MTGETEGITKHRDKTDFHRVADDKTRDEIGTDRELT